MNNMDIVDIEKEREEREENHLLRKGILLKTIYINIMKFYTHNKPQYSKEDQNSIDIYLVKLQQTVKDLDDIHNKKYGKYVEEQEKYIVEMKENILDIMKEDIAVYNVISTAMEELETIII